MAISPSSVSQNGVTATLTLSGSTVTVNVSSTSLFWRVRGRNPDTTHYITENRNSSGSFTCSEDGKEFAFQVCSSSGSWSSGDFFTVNFDYTLTISQGTGTSITVKRNGTTLSNGATIKPGDSLSITISASTGYNISSSSHSNGTYTVSGDVYVYAYATLKTYTLSISQGTGSSISVKRNGAALSNGATITYGDSLAIAISANTGYDLSSRSHNDGTYTVSGNISVSATATVKSYKLSISAGTGSTITVNRTSSPKKGASTGNLSDGATIYYSDVLKITFAAGAGYEITTHTVNGTDFTSGNTHTVTANVTVIAITNTLGLVYIDNGTTLEAYLIYIDNGSSWEQHIPYIDNGSGWDMCN